MFILRKLIEILFEFKDYGNGIELLAKHRLNGTVKFDINHHARRQNSKLRELQKWQPNYMYFIPLVNNHCLIKYLKVNILKPFFPEFLFAILPPLSTS